MKTFSKRTTLALIVSVLTAPAALADGHSTTHMVEISGFAFKPPVLTISAGDSVQFVNKDGAPHTATAGSGAFDTGRLGKGDSAALTFSGAGSFDYICKFHPNMKGQIIVQ